MSFLLSNIFFWAKGWDFMSFPVLYSNASLQRGVCGADWVWQCDFHVRFVAHAVFISTEIATANKRYCQALEMFLL